MKRISVQIAIALLVCVASAATASAKVKSRVQTIGQDFVVAGTSVKAGTYDFRFDDEKNELSVVDRKTKETVAKVEARAEAWSKGANAIGIQLTGAAAPLSFAGIAFDDKQIVRVSASAAQAR
ncbi:MAG TPA: hypothetical protein VF668_21845 [Pyrinomonadaceae bacterium]|jgi:hypothetical protein